MARRGELDGIRTHLWIQSNRASVKRMVEVVAQQQPKRRFEEKPRIISKHLFVVLQEKEMNELVAQKSFKR